MELEELHNCKNCQGKMVMISVDKVGISRCGYCGMVVDYNKFFWENMLTKIEAGDEKWIKIAEDTKLVEMLEKKGSSAFWNEYKKRLADAGFYERYFKR